MDVYPELMLCFDVGVEKGISIVNQQKYLHQWF